MRSLIQQPGSLIDISGNNGQVGANGRDVNYQTWGGASHSKDDPCYCFGKPWNMHDGYGHSNTNCSNTMLDYVNSWSGSNGGGGGSAGGTGGLLLLDANVNGSLFVNTANGVGGPGGASTPPPIAIDNNMNLTTISNNSPHVPLSTINFLPYWQNNFSSAALPQLGPYNGNYNTGIVPIDSSFYNTYLTGSPGAKGSDGSVGNYCVVGQQGCTSFITPQQ